MDIFTIVKLMLGSIGVSDPVVKFDAENKTIELRYKYQGQEQIKKISFQEAEDFFKA